MERRERRRKDEITLQTLTGIFYTVQ